MDSHKLIHIILTSVQFTYRIIFKCSETMLDSADHTVTEALRVHLTIRHRKLAGNVRSEKWFKTSGTVFVLLNNKESKL
jgi:hypothetical protein